MKSRRTLQPWKPFCSLDGRQDGDEGTIEPVERRRDIDGVALMIYLRKRRILFPFTIVLYKFRNSGKIKAESDLRGTHSTFREVPTIPTRWIIVEKNSVRGGPLWVFLDWFCGFVIGFVLITL